MCKEIIFLVEESTEGGYEARALGYSIFTEGETYDEVKNNIIDAVRCHFEDEDVPKIIRLHFVKDEVVVQKEDDLYVAKCLDNRVASQGETIEEALDNLEEALELYYEFSGGDYFA